MRNTLQYLVVASSKVNNLRYLPLIQSLHKLINVVFSQNWVRALFGTSCGERRSTIGIALYNLCDTGLIVVTFVISNLDQLMWPNHCVDYRLKASQVVLPGTLVSVFIQVSNWDFVWHNISADRSLA